MERETRGISDNDTRKVMIGVILAFGMTVMYDMLKVYFNIINPNPVPENINMLFAACGAIIGLFLLFFGFVRNKTADNSTRLSNTGRINRR